MWRTNTQKVDDNNQVVKLSSLETIIKYDSLSFLCVSKTKLKLICFCEKLNHLIS